MVSRRLLGSCLALVLLGGCGSGERPGAVDKGKPKSDEVEIVVETVPIPEALPPKMCFVGIHDYDVMLFGQDLRSRDSCSRLADRFFPGAKHLPWAPAAISNPDATNECVLFHGSALLSVARGDPDVQGPRFERAYELAERACDGLRNEGWKDAPLSEW